MSHNRSQINNIINEEAADITDECPHCGALTHFVMEWNGYHVDRYRHMYNYVMFRCKPCGKLVLKIAKSSQNPYATDEFLEFEGWTKKYPDLHSEPEQRFSEFVPENVLEDYGEGLRCLASGSPRAAASMFRRSLQNALIDLGADQGVNLIEQIKSMPRLTDDIKDWAHNIRIFGNWGAHPQEDMLKNIDAQKAEEVKDFIDDFFNYVYVMPKRVEATRSAHKKASAEADAKEEADAKLKAEAEAQNKAIDPKDMIVTS